MRERHWLGRQRALGGFRKIAASKSGKANKVVATPVAAKPTSIPHPNARPGPGVAGCLTIHAVASQKTATASEVGITTSEYAVVGTNNAQPAVAIIPMI